MALKAILDNLDGVPEALHGEYVEKDGKFELQVEGMKTQGDIDRINGALQKEKKDHKALQTRVALLGDHKIEDVVTALDRIPELEAAAEGKMDDEKINQIVETRIKAKLAPVERERDQLKTKVGELEGTVGDYQTKDKTRSIHDAVRKAGREAKMLPEAMDDALMLSERLFEVDDTGKVVTKDGVGVTPGIEPSSWMTDIQKTRPHWWGASAGGGAGGNRGGVDTSKNPFSAEHWNMTEQGKLVTTDRSKAEQLAKLAGTTIGGQKPQPKK